MGALVVLVAAGPGRVFSQSEAMGLRQIVVASEGEAARIRQLVADGTAAFDALAVERSLDASATRGGYLGRLSPSDLRVEFRNAVADLAPGDVSAPVGVGNAYFLFQAVSEAESEWMDLDEAGAAALAGGRNEEAAGDFEQALELAESYAPDSPQLLRSLDSLAMTYQLLDRPVESEALYRRALALVGTRDAPPLERAQILNGLGLAVSAGERYDEAESLYLEARAIREEILGANHPEIAGIQLNLADLYAAREEFTAAAALYEQSIALLEASLGADHPATAAARTRRTALGPRLVPALLDRLSTLLSLAEFKDDVFEETVAEIAQLIPLVALTERSYVQIKDILLEVGLSEETEAFLRLGLEGYPDSRILRIYVAELMANTGRTRDALALLQEAADLPRPDGLDAATDRRQLGVIFQRIGDLRRALTDLDAAIAAYRRSLEIDPAVAGGHVSLGRAYFTSNRIDEALAEYERAVAENPEDPESYLRLAEGRLAGGDWEAAESAAREAIDHGTTDSRALYFLGTALVRMGRIEDGQEQLREYSAVEAGFRDIEHRNREVDAIDGAALEALEGGDSPTAVQILSDGIELYPDADRLHMNLAMVQSRLGDHEAAVRAYRRMLDEGLGRPFLVHRNLAGEYAALGDLEASRRHRQIYLDSRENELIVYAPE